MSTETRHRLIAANQREYGEDYGRLTFPAPEQALQAMQRRFELLAAMRERVAEGYGGTKLDCNGLSPGCRICAEGNWSCLFITGRCNCRCFYCPTAQTDNHLPTTNTVDFRTPAQYVAYLQRFGFRGASISGGEPLLSPKRSLAYIREIKKHFGNALHVWLYTNGTLADTKLLRQLADAGLDEIRFDIGASDYRLDKLRLATRLFPTVTVEIPAIPEESSRLKSLLLPLKEAGAMHLNLHQLRLTPHNITHLVRRGYTFLHGEKVTVLESELTALEVLRHSLDTDCGLPVNYCSFVFKNRYQGRAARLRNGGFMVKPFEELTANGYIRTLTLIGEEAVIDRQVQRFKDAAADPGRWQRGSIRGALQIHPQLIPLVDRGAFRLRIDYAGCRQLPSISYKNPFVTLQLTANKSIVVERFRAAPALELDGEQRDGFFDQLITSQWACRSSNPEELAWLSFEETATGLQEYF